MMLSVSDAALIERDTAIPGLATLLDPDALVAALRHALPGVDLGAGQVTYVKYKPGTNCLAGARLEVNGSLIDVYGKAFGADASIKIRNALRRPGVAGPLGNGRIVLEDLGIVVAVFPNDSKIVGITDLTNELTRGHVFKELMPGRSDLWESTLERLVYKPERRWVGRLVTRGRASAALKVYTDDEYQAALRYATRFCSREALRVVAPLGFLDSHRMLAFAWISDPPLSDVLADPALDLRKVATAGAALAALHSQNPLGLPRLTRRSEAAALREDANFLALIHPTLAGRATQIAKEIGAKLEQAPAMDRPLHGDFHARQILLGETTATILDLDRAVRGDPAADLGNFFAHLERETVRGSISAERKQALTQALCDGYRSATMKPLPARVGLYAAASMFRLAPRFFRYLEPDWHESADQFLHRAQATLDEFEFPS